MQNKQQNLLHKGKPNLKQINTDKSIDCKPATV